MRVIEDINIAGEIADELKQNARMLVRQTIRRIEARWKGSLSGPRSGRTYRKGAIVSRHKGRTIGYKLHRASAPGEAPATDTGNLVNSIYARMTGNLMGEVGSNAECAPVLEFGGAHMAARPSLTPAVKAEWPTFESGMQTLIRERGNG